MATERIAIIVTDQGTRIVRRNLRGVGTTAASSARGVNVLKTALLGLGSAIVLRRLVEMSDSFILIQNRLGLVAKDAQNLTKVTRDLLDVSNETRTDFLVNADIFSRFALATRALGASQQEIIDLTRSLNQAIVLSGARAQEASNGMIQFAQGLASGALRGDELRSVLEQLPLVADVIAQELGVTRGQLRKIGETGEITAEVILRAFRNARGELEQKFAKTISTVGQALQILENNVIFLVGELNKGTGIISVLVDVLLVLANTVDFLARNLEFLGDVVTTLLASFAGFRLRRFILETTAAAAAEKAAAAAAVSAAESNLVLQAALVRTVQLKLAKVDATILETRAQIASAGADLRSTEAQVALAAALRTVNALTVQRAALTAQMVAAQQGLAASTTELAGAQATLAGTSGLGKLKAVLAAVTTRIKAFALALFGTPLGAALTIIVAITAALIGFRNRIKLANGELGTLGDFFAVTFDAIRDGLSAVGELLADFFEPALTALRNFIEKYKIGFQDVLLFAASILDAFTKLFSAVFTAIGAGVITAFEAITKPELILSLGKKLANGFITIFEFILNEGLIQGLNKLVETVAAGLNFIINQVNKLGAGLEPLSFEVINPLDLSEFKFDIPQDQDLTLLIKDSILNGFQSGLEEGGGLVDATLRLLNEAQRRASDRAGGQAGSGSEVNLTFDRLRADLEEESRLLLLTADARAVRNRELKIEEQLTRQNTRLSEGPGGTKGLLNLELQRVQNLQKISKVLDSVRGDTIDLAFAQGVLSEEVEKGNLSLDQANRALRELRANALKSKTDVESGFERGLLNLANDFEDFASLTERALVNAFQGAEDALVDFVKTGELNFSKLVDSILADLARLVIRQAITAPLAAALASAFSPAGSLAGVAAQAAAGGIAGRANGGRVGAGQTVAVGERGIELFRPDQSGTIIPNERLFGGAPEPARITVVNVQDPNEIPSAMNTPAGEQVILNVIRKNKRVIQRDIA